MEKKVIKVGNSLAVTLPKSFVDKAKLKAGQTVHVQENNEYKSLKISSGEIRDDKSSLTPEFKDWLDSFNKKYKTALKELARK